MTLSKKFTCIAIFIYAFIFGLSNLAIADSDYFSAWENTTVWPVTDQTLSVEQAYVVQKTWVEKVLQGDHPVAYKRGLTTKDSLAQFGLTEPVTGVLSSQSRIVSTPSERLKISRSIFIKPMIELELGLLLLKPRTEVFTSVDEFRQAVAAYKAIIELPDLGFASKPSGIDVIASNVAARYYIEKSGMISDFSDLEKVSVSLKRDNETIFSGLSGDILDGQMLAGFKMANQLISQGWELRSGQVLMTGSIGPMIPAEPGMYVADFGDSCGSLSFEITD